MKEIETLSIIGLGKLGASMGAAMASRGFKIIGNDVSDAAVNSFKDGHAPVQETNLEKILQQYKDRLNATMSHRDAVLGSEASFVIVPTPSDDRGAFSLQFAKWAMKELGKALKEKDDYHLIIMSSTVLPGSCRYGLIPILEEESGKKCGADFGFCYSPEFIALGSVIHDFLHPDFTLVGEFDNKSGDALEAIYTKVMLEGPPCRRMTIENAELTKVCVNSYVTTKITFANMVRDLCERIPGGDVDVVTEALGSDARIGSKYLKGGLGFGGPCFPRDNVALAFLAESLGSNAKLSRIVDDINRALPSTIVEKFSDHFSAGKSVTVLGLSYKPFSHVVEESQAIMLMEQLAQRGCRVVGYDPLANESARAVLGDKAIVADTLEAAVSGADVIIVANPDRKIVLELQSLNISDAIILDCWRILDPNSKNNNKILSLGTPVVCNNEVLEALWQQ